MKHQEPKIPVFTTQRRFFCLLLCLLLLIAGLSVRYTYELRSAKEVKSVDSLSGQRIGTCVGWETDYLLTAREDVTLLRYDTFSDALQALRYNQIDALGADEPTVAVILGRTSGLEVLSEPIAYLGGTFYAGTGEYAQNVLADLNEYARYFRTSDIYEDFYRRLLNGENERSYFENEITRVENGPVIHVGFIPEYYPETYTVPGSVLPEGYGVEFLERFAAEYGYTIEYRPVSGATIYADLAVGIIEIGCGKLSDVYAEETELMGFHMTEPYYYSNVYLMRIADGQEMEITGDVEL